MRHKNSLPPTSLSLAKTGKPRIDTFDILKGIGILLMIIGHSTGKMVWLRDFIFSFHMPLFFMISGYFFRPVPFGQQIVKNFKRLMIPYLFTALILALYALAFAYAREQNLWDVLLVRLRATLLGSGAPKVLGMGPSIGAIWFLAAMFWGLLWLNLAVRTRYPLLFCLFLSALCFAIRDYVFLPLSFQPGTNATLFLYLGYEAKKQQLLPKLGYCTLAGLKQMFRPAQTGSSTTAATLSEQSSASSRPWICVGVSLCLWYASYMKGKLEMSCDFYKLWYFDMLAALCFTWIVYQLAHYLNGTASRLKRMLCFFGRYSLIVLCFHLMELNCMPWNKICPWDLGACWWPVLWMLKIVWAFLAVQLTLHTPFLRWIFQIKK